MRYLHEFLRVSLAERWLLIKAVLFLEAIKLGMRLLPFRILRRLLALAATAPASPRHARCPSAKRLSWTVEAASQHTPGAKTCLTRPLAPQALFAGRGHPALLRIGAFRGKHRQFQAHASGTTPESLFEPARTWRARRRRVLGDDVLDTPFNSAYTYRTDV